jgi:hypothetical protein
MGGILAFVSVFLVVVASNTQVTDITDLENASLTDTPVYPYNILYGDKNMTDWWGVVVSNTAWTGRGDFFTQDYVNFLADEGATALRIMLDKYWWDENFTNPLGYPYKTYITNISSWCTTAGINCYLDLTRDANFNGVDTEFGTADKATVITDAASKAAWIAWGTDVVTTCSPDGISIMNEPNETDAIPVSVAVWTSFVDDCITAWRAVDSNLTVFVQGMPWYTVEDSDFVAFLNTHDDKVIMQFHMYYEYPPAGESGANTARTAYGQGQFALGKTLLYSYLDEKFTTFNKSRVNLGEVGVYNNQTRDPWPSPGVPNDVNWQVFMRDLYEYAVDRELHGLFQFGVGYKYAMVDYSGTPAFTPYGEEWAAGVPDYVPPDPDPPPEPPEPPPPIKYTLTVTHTTGGTVSDLQNYTVAAGTILGVGAYPDSGYAFVRWYLNGSAYLSSTPVYITMQANNSLHAVFEPIPQTGEYTLTVLGSVGGYTNFGGWLH